MKKTGIVVIFLMLCLALVSCGGTSTTADSDASGGSGSGGKVETSATSTEPEEHTPATIQQSTDKYTAYINDYVGKNCASFGYYSLGGDRMDSISNGCIEIKFVTEDGSYVDISDDNELKKYCVCSQNIDPNTEVKFTYDVDSDGVEYDSLVSWQSIKEIVLQVKKVGEKAEFATPLTKINVPTDKYTSYVKDYVGRNLASCGYVSLGGDYRDEYGEGTIELILVSNDGSYIDINDETVLPQYVVTGQNIAPNTEIKYTFSKDSSGNEYGWPDYQSIESIDLYVDKLQK